MGRWVGPDYSSLATEAVLPTVLEDVARALRLAHVAIWFSDGDALGLGAVHGSPPPERAVRDAASGEEAVSLADQLLADVVLMDLKMPGMGGIEATRAIMGRNPHVAVIVVTMFEDEESVFAALKAGARGYVLKDADRGMLLRAIRAVAQGEALLAAPIARRALEPFAQPPPVAPPPLTNRTLFDELTPRETEVLRLIARGLRNHEIATKLVISEKTVGNHVSNIFTKLQVNDRSQAIVRALRGGLTSEEQSG